MSRRKIGRVREHLAEILRDLGLDCHPEDLWIQEGGYRRLQWDLARWGTHPIKWLSNPKGIKEDVCGEPHIGQTCIVSSWDTMTDCVRYGIEVHHPAPHPHSGWDEMEVCRAQ